MTITTYLPRVQILHHATALTVENADGTSKGKKQTARVRIEGDSIDGTRDVAIRLKNKKPCCCNPFFKRYLVFDTVTQKEEYIWVNKNSLKIRLGRKDLVVATSAPHAAPASHTAISSLHTPLLSAKTVSSITASTSLPLLPVEPTISKVEKEDAETDPSYELTRRVAFAFEYVNNKTRPDLAINDHEQEEIRKLFNSFTVVTEPTVLERHITKTALSILVTPSEKAGESPHGYALYDRVDIGEKPIAKGGFKYTFFAVGLHDGDIYVAAEYDPEAVAKRKNKPADKYQLILRREIGFSKLVKGARRVVQTPTICTHKGKVYFIMQHYQSGDLQMEINNGRLATPFMALRTCCNIFEGLTALHSRNIIHRDLKPQNILKHWGNVAITDLGLATLADEEGPFGIRHICGTREYNAPEMNPATIQERPLTKAIDVWAAGQILYLLMNRRGLFEPKNKNWMDPVWEGIPEISGNLLLAVPVNAPKEARLQALIRSMLAIDPTARPPIETAFETITDIYKTAQYKP